MSGIESIHICSNSPSISHLLLVDDSLILMRANVHNANNLKKVSTAKSSILFRTNTSVLVREEVCRDLDILTEALTMVGLDRTFCFQHLIDRICKAQRVERKSPHYAR